MDINLILLRKNGVQKIVPLHGAVTTVGRRGDCDLIIPIINVSRRHCQFEIDADTFKLRDLGSINGTFLNGDRIEDAPLKTGDVVSIGPVKLKIEIAAATPAQQKETPPKQPPPKLTGLDELPPAPKAVDLSDSDFFAKLDIDGNDPAAVTTHSGSIFDDSPKKTALPSSEELDHLP